MKLVTDRHKPTDMGPVAHGREFRPYHVTVWRTPDAKRRIIFGVQDWRLLVYSSLCTPSLDI